MQSKAKDVSEYLREVSEERKPILKSLRKMCLKHLKGFEESMDYGMPSYKHNGTVEVAFASQKNSISLYILKQDVMKKNVVALKPYKTGKGSISIPAGKPLDSSLVVALLEDTVASAKGICDPRQ